MMMMEMDMEKKNNQKIRLEETILEAKKYSLRVFNSSK